MSYDSLSSQSTFLRRTGFVAEEQPKAPAARRLGSLTVPTLIVIGDRDEESTAEIADLLAAQVPGARKAVIRETAHFPNMEKSAAFNRVVLSFLRKRKSAAGKSGGKGKSRKPGGLSATGSVQRK
jgi:pimeloyl-ACP methyl ester carboxylesterase